MKLSVKKIADWRKRYLEAQPTVGGLVEPEGFAGKIQACLLTAITTGCAWQGIPLERTEEISKDVWDYFMRRLRQERGEQNN